MSWVCKRVWMCACLRHHPRWTLTGQEEALKWCGLSGGLIQPEWNIRLCTPTQQTKATADHLKLDSSDTRKQHEVEHWPCSIWIVSKVKHQQNKIYYYKNWSIKKKNTIHAYNDLNKPLLVFNFYIKSKLIFMQVKNRRFNCLEITIQKKTSCLLNATNNINIIIIRCTHIFKETHF